ncbi:MAG: methyltransferase domain-containing protein [Hyphomicrobiaceae bacterium]|nr:methyltransferase domain-containing protein [Hyphomicrobiaceae bacterium]
MAAKPRTSTSVQEKARLGITALQAGDFRTAKLAFSEAVQADKRHPGLRFNLAMVEEGLGEIDAAARELCEALRLKPQMIEAARRLALIARRYVLDQPEALEPFGIKAALAFDELDRQPLVDLALRHLAGRPQLAPLLERVRSGDADGAARDLAGKRTGDLLRNDLFLAALEQGVVADPDVERLLTAVRRLVLLYLPDERLQDRALFAFLSVLEAQTALNEHVWAESEAERGALASLRLDAAALSAGNVDAAFQLLKGLLYRRLDQLDIGGLDADAAAGVRPKALAATVTSRLRVAAEEKALEAALPRLTPVTDPTSVRVAGQYQAHPYPRWASVQRPQAGSLRRALARYFAEERLSFMDQPFDVLIAGTGTGHQAALAQLAYGGMSRVLGVDISRPSLAYARRKANELALSGLELAEADILALPETGRRFEVVEAIGVLHHMADPFAGWRALRSVLKPGGIMLVGLYSATSRRNIKALREEPGYPGAGASDALARDYRAALMARGEGEPGVELMRSRDFYALSDFRDLVLHEHEVHMTLDDIERFLAENGLAFRGFTLTPHVFEHFRMHYKDDAWPGSFANWRHMEETHTSLFDGMYQFWCEATG